MVTAPTVAEVERIARLAEPAARNLRITWCYYELSQALRPLLGDSANWCTFGAWASKQAGRTIRHEDLSRTLEEELGKSPELAERLGRLARDLGRNHLEDERAGLRNLAKRHIVPAARFDKASDAVGRGNLKVFAEIGREFARYLAETGEDDAFDESRLEEFCRGLRPGEPPAGQGHLRAAFRSYHRARFESDARRRAQLILLANLEVGFHEQTRLQPEIREALNAPVVDARRLRRSVLARLSDERRGFRAQLWSAYLRLTGPLDRLWGRLTELVQRVARRLVTDLLMTLELPGGRVRLGKDLRATFPESLRTIDEPQLAELLARVDRTPGTVAGSGAEDWSDLPQRMHFITDLFRSHQEERRLLGPPLDRPPAG